MSPTPDIPTGAPRGPYNRSMSKRGFSLVEVLAGLVILGLIVTTSLGVFYERQRRMQRAQETVRAVQAMLNEAELVRKTSFVDLDARSGTSFRAAPEIISDLENVSTVLSVEQTSPVVKSVTLTVRWRSGTRRESMLIVRSDTGGGNLW